MNKINTNNISSTLNSPVIIDARGKEDGKMISPLEIIEYLSEEVAEDLITIIWAYENDQ